MPTRSSSGMTTNLCVTLVTTAKTIRHLLNAAGLSWLFLRPEGDEVELRVTFHLENDWGAWFQVFHEGL